MDGRTDGRTEAPVPISTPPAPRAGGEGHARAPSSPVSPFTTRSWQPGSLPRPRHLQPSKSRAVPQSPRSHRLSHLPSCQNPTRDQPGPGASRAPAARNQGTPPRDGAAHHGATTGPLPRAQHKCWVPTAGSVVSHPWAPASDLHQPARARERPQTGRRSRPRCRGRTARPRRCENPAGPRSSWAWSSRACPSKGAQEQFWGAQLVEGIGNVMDCCPPFLVAENFLTIYSLHIGIFAREKYSHHPGLFPPWT